MTMMKGTVIAVSSKPITSKGRTFRIHYVELEDGTSINVGFKQPFQVGDTFSGNTEEKFGELKLVTGPVSDAPAPSTRASSSSGTKNTKFPIPHDSNEYAIIRQNALTNAVSLCNGSKSTKTGITDADVEFVIKIAYKFAEFSSGHREQRILKETGAKVARLPTGE